LTALAESPFFAGLTSLDVSGNDIGEAGVRAALDSPSFARLHTLNLSRNPIGDAGATALARSPLLVRMVARQAKLELRGHAGGPIGAAGASALANSPAMAHCAALDLTGNDIGDAGLAALAGSSRLSEVRVLKLARNQITDGGVVAIRPVLPALLSRLRLLDLSENRLASYGMGLLKEARGELPVTIDVSGNVQSTAAPVPLGAVVPDVLRDVAEAAEAAELRRRVAHPRTRPGDRPSPSG
jgi:hypothetical protein